MKMTIEIDTEHDAPLVDAVMRAIDGLKTEVFRSAPQRPNESPYQASSRKIREIFRKNNNQTEAWKATKRTRGYK